MARVLLFSVIGFLVLCCPCDLIAEECTIGVAKGIVTQDGRPLLWKSRKWSNTQPNHVEYFAGSPYSYIGVKGMEQDYMLMGVNSVGLCTGNSLVGPAGYNALFMSHCLQNFATVDEVRQYVKEEFNAYTLRASGCFPFVDAKGDAVMFEIYRFYWYIEYDTINKNRIPQHMYGWVVRANEFHQNQDGTDDLDVLGRYLTARANIGGLIGIFSPVSNLTARTVMQGDNGAEGYEFMRYGPGRVLDTIAESGVCSSMVVHGVSPGDVQLEVIIVDDHSSDATGEIADALAREDGRVRVLHAPTLPPEWLGKANAMQHGLDLATGEFILISDADILHDADCLGTALADMRQQGSEFLSFYPRIRCESLWENAVVPLINSGLGEFPKHPALAAGAFMLVEARALRAAGGMDPIRQAPLDDVALACHLKERGHSVDFCFAPELVSVRLYKGNREAFWGITKTVLAPFAGRLWMLAPAVLLSALMYWTPPALVLLGLLTQQPMLWLGGLAIHGLQMWSLRVSRRTVATRPLKLACFPIVVISIVACSVRALHAHRTEGAVLWRGRRLPIAQPEMNAAGTRGLRPCS